jgi:hypothetical protein
MRVWIRAVVTPASRRAQGTWVGAVLVGGLLFGPTGLHPRDVTELAWRAPGFGAVLAATWVLLFLPTARGIVRADAAIYLQSLPGPRRAQLAVGGLALLGLQAPWLVLWVLGDGARGVAVVVALTIAIVLLGRWRPAPCRARAPRWSGAVPALCAIYARALIRRAPDAVMRGIGLAVLAGLAAGLVIRNNELAGTAAARLGASAIAVLLVPGWAGALLPLLDAHGASAWLAAALGIHEATRRATLAATIAMVYVTGALIASLAAAALIDAATLAWLALVSSLSALATSVAATRLLLWAERSQVARSMRAVVGAIVASSACVLALAVMS